MDNVFGYLIAAAIFVWAAYYIWKIIRLYRRRAASKLWPLAIAKVIKKDIFVQYGSRGGKSYVPKVTYVYSVLGTQVTKTVSVGDGWTQKAAASVLEEIGETIKARYNPQKPKEHFTELERFTARDFLSLVVALLFFIISMIVLLSGSKAPP